MHRRDPPIAGAFRDGQRYVHWEGEILSILLSRYIAGSAATVLRYTCDSDAKNWTAMATNRGLLRQIDADSQDLPARNSVRNEPYLNVRQVRLRAHAQGPTQGRKAPLFFPENVFFTLSVINVRPPHLAGPPPLHPWGPRASSGPGQSRSRIVIEPASVPEAAAKPALRHAGLYGARLVAWIPFLR